MLRVIQEFVLESAFRNPKSAIVHVQPEAAVGHLKGARSFVRDSRVWQTNSF